MFLEIFAGLSCIVTILGTLNSLGICPYCGKNVALGTHLCPEMEAAQSAQGGVGIAQLAPSQNEAATYSTRPLPTSTLSSSHKQDIRVCKKALIIVLDGHNAHGMQVEDISDMLARSLAAALAGENEPKVRRE